MMKRLISLCVALTLAVSLPLLNAAQAAAAPEYNAAIYGLTLDDATDNVTALWYGQDVTHVVVEAYSYVYNSSIPENPAVYTKIASVTQAVTLEYTTVDGVTIPKANQQTVAPLGTLSTPNVRLVAWLLDANGAIVSEQLVDDSYTFEMRAISGQKASDYTELGYRVVDLSGEKYGEGSFFALAQDVVLVNAAEATGLTVTKNDAIYSFGGVADSTLADQLRGLRAGDKLCVVHEDNAHANFDFYGLEVSSVSEDASGAFHVHTAPGRLKLDQYAEASLFSTTTIHVLEGFKIELENLNYELTAKADLDLVLGAGHKGWSSAYVQIQGVLDVWEINFTVKTPTFTALEVPLYKAALGAPGLADVAIEFTFEMFTSASGSVQFDITGSALGFKATVSWAHGIQFKNLCNAPDFQFDGFSFDAEIFAGFGIGPTLEVFTIFTVSLKLYVGPWMHFNVNNIEMWDKNQRWHACEGFKCFAMDLTVRISIHGIIAMGKLSKDISKTLYKTPHLADYYDSFTFDDEGNTTCPHQAYRLRVKALTHDDQAVQGANVYYTDVQEHYGKYATAKTGGDGVGEIYIPIQQSTVQAEADLTMPNGRTYRFRAEQSFEQKGYKKDTTDLVQPDLTLRFNTQAYTITFADSSASGAAQGLPSPLTYYRGEGEVVTLPDAVPTLSGNMFRGWSTIKDPNWDTGIVQYAPGEAIDFADPALQDPHVMLYPVWGSPNRTIVVLYNANGGKDAPEAQIFADDINDLTLSTQEPTREGWKFLGWGDAPDETSTVLYAPGDVIPNPGHNLTFYAQWELDTFGIYTITYDNNGAPGPVPLPQTQTTTGRVVLRDAPVWDEQHIFRGYAIDGSGALVPVCFPGMSYHFDKDVTLKALWDVQYHIIQGNGSKWEKEGVLPLRFVGDGDFQRFDYVLVDGKLLPLENYVASASPTIIDLTPAYLNSLPLGVHTIQLIYQDGETDVAFFRIVAPLPPATGDDTPIGWLLMLAVASGAVAMALAKRRRVV